MWQTLEVCQAKKRTAMILLSRNVQARASTYNQKHQNAFWEDRKVEESHDWCVTGDNDGGFSAELSTVKQHNRNENVILNNQDDILKVIGPTVLVREVVQSRDRIADNLNRQRLQRNSFCAFLSINCENLRKFWSKEKTICSENYNIKRVKLTSSTSWWLGTTRCHR